MNPANAAALSQHYGFPVPAKPGLTTTEMVEAAARSELDVLYLVGGNFLRTLPEPEYVRAALQRAVAGAMHQDIIVTDQMFIEPGEAVLLLPAKTRYEQDDGGTETSTERRVMFTPEIPRQVGEARAEWKILFERGRRGLPRTGGALRGVTGQALREEIARVVPFHDGVQHLRKTGDAFQYGGPHLCAGGCARRLTVGPRCNRSTCRRRRRRMEAFTSAPAGKQFNTLIYADVDPLNGAPREPVLMNEG